MRYQQDEKGLFTFYKEQQLLQDQLKIKRFHKEKAYPNTNKLNIMQQSQLISRLYPQSKVKIVSQPNNNQELNSQQCNKFTQIGSVIIPNKKLTQRPQHQQQKGIYLPNKNIQFQQLEKCRRSVNFKVKRHKRWNLKQKYEFQTGSKNESQQKYGILPLIGKTQDCKTERELIFLPSCRNQLNPHKFKSNSHIFTKQQNDSNQAKELKRYVSYIQYNKDYFNESSVGKRSTNLNQQQKKIYNLLSSRCKAQV